MKKYSFLFLNLAMLVAASEAFAYHFVSCGGSVKVRGKWIAVCLADNGMYYVINKTASGTYTASTETVTLTQEEKTGYATANKIPLSQVATAAQ